MNKFLTSEDRLGWEQTSDASYCDVNSYYKPIQKNMNLLSNISRGVYSTDVPKFYSSPKKEVKIWILFDEYGYSQQKSLKKALNLYLKLSNIPCLNVETYLLESLNPINTIPNYMLKTSISKHYITGLKHSAEVSLRNHSVWKIPFPLMLQHTISQIKEKCKKMSKLQTNFKG